MHAPRKAVAVPVGVRELKSHLSTILCRVKGGEIVTVTERKRPIALVVPLRFSQQDDLLRDLVRVGRLSWMGGKPVGAKRPAQVRGASVSNAVIEDRR